MASLQDAEVYDLLILVDATASMSNYLTSLNQSLQQIISISALTNCFQRIGLLAYRDYCDTDLLEWSGWRTTDALSLEDQPDLVQKAKLLRATGGGDYPEATKTGLAKAYSVMRHDATTLILLYTDAPPHSVRGEDTGYPNGIDEQAALRKEGSYDGYGHHFADWVEGAHMLANGEKRAHVMCMLQNDQALLTSGYYSYLSAATKGACILLTNTQPRHISEVTVEILLAWMGVKKDGTAETSLPAKLAEYPAGGQLEAVQTELEASAQGLLDSHSRHGGKVKLDSTSLSSTVLDTRMPKKKSPLRDFAKTYKESGAYRALVTTHLRGIIERDVSAISLNPVFGSLWRTFCSDRENDNRQELLDLFGRKVYNIKNDDERAKMKTWLEESYDYTGEVLETVAEVPEELQFPCVCLDPTLTFMKTKNGGNVEDDDENNRPITAFRRDELLELGRSCDWRILRRLGRIITRLTFIESADAMQAHIAATDEKDVTRIPLALADPKYGRKFWRILLHIVVPGTMLSARAAALLAALTIRLGVRPLKQAAEMEMLLWRQKWNDLEVPETWSVNCLSLLMDADKAYQAQRPQLKTLTLDGGHGLLQAKDRILFESLIDYKLLELNLATTLHAQVAWTPQKVSMPVGPLVVCKTCTFPRSVTVMAPGGVCGLCFYLAEHPEEKSSTDIACGVTEKDNAHTHASWIECSVQQCRAQYIVYNTDGLNVRPKCHYCRNGSTAPVLECSKCLSRMIWPEEYRVEGASDFICQGCQSGKKTEVTVETTGNQLREENGTSWLLTNEGGKLAQPFNNRTLFHTASSAKPLDDFAARVHILPGKDSANLTLHLQGKPIRNTSNLINELYSWVFRRRTESGTCSLCFSNFRKDLLLPACERSGCHQRVCRDCLEGWYGLNAAGRIVNTAALHCPFCRRRPTTKTLARNGTGVHALGSLTDAVAHNGTWIYAWCIACGHAKQYMERVCAGGAPPELTQWTCEDCEAAKGTRQSIRPCPGCGVETQKTGGCDHICCTQCATHWCFFCGEKQDEGAIYEHMSAAHGGYYGGGDDEEDGEEDDDEYRG